MRSFQIFKQSKSRNYVEVLCFQIHNAHHTKWSFSEITCSKIDFLEHKFSSPQSGKCSESILELKVKMKELGNIDCLCISC